MKTIIYILAFAAIFTSCSKIEEGPNIQELNKEFIGAWNNRDSDKVISMLADDVDFVQGEIHFNGKSEVADKWVNETLGTISDLKTNVVSSGVDETMAYEAGTFSVDVLPSGPNEPHGVGEGNFILLWKKGEDGKWKLSYAQLEDMPVQAKGM
ncbi:YybH family protein [Pontibacter ruber]|uniref:YybH family protein n=1 Tax=Pontibacter ruber TaxID=1343895 RepID=A0ABW5CSH9_9BACT|nr:nuclear transport factor 2 family protein [Pontibacter ruber]